MTTALVTGIGAVTPVGIGVGPTWRALLEGASGIRRPTRFDPADHKVQIVGEVPGFDARDHLPKPYDHHMESYAHYGVVAAEEALAQAGLPYAGLDPERFGIVVGTGYGCTRTNADAVHRLDELGPRRMGPTCAVFGAQDIVAGYLSMAHDARGEAVSLSVACASGTAALGHGLRLVRSGAADVVVVVGAEGAVEPKDLAVVAGAQALTSTHNDSPTTASRPFDRARDGFVLSCGGGAMVLESEEHARRRGAKPLARLLGYGAASDAHHLTAPHPEGRGARTAIRKALADARRDPRAVDHVNAHGTGTRLNDEVEAAAVRDVIGEGTEVTSTKSMTGHMIGAAGVVEAIACVEALRTGCVPPTINCDDPEFPFIDVVRTAAREARPRLAVSNSFGFGGHCASVVLEKVA